MTAITVHVLMKAIWPRRLHDGAKSVGAVSDLSSGFACCLLTEWYWSKPPSTVLAYQQCWWPDQKEPQIFFSLSLVLKLLIVCGFCIHFFFLFLTEIHEELNSQSGFSHHSSGFILRTQFKIVHADSHVNEPEPDLLQLNSGEEDEEEKAVVVLWQHQTEWQGILFSDDANYWFIN